LKKTSVASLGVCPIERTVALIGGKWKPYVLFHLHSGRKRYSELQRLIPQTSDRMLTRTLRELEADRLIDRAVFAEVPVRVEYKLSSDGLSLMPILNDMLAWTQARSSRA
jgi:DNA-binding HxlR family transcriptional regulator